MVMKLICWCSWCPIKTVYVKPNLLCLQLSLCSLYKSRACICLMKYIKLYNFTSVKSILLVTKLQLQAETNLVFTYQLQITKHYHAATNIKITVVGSGCCLVYLYWIQCKQHCLYRVKEQNNLKEMASFQYCYGHSGWGKTLRLWHQRYKTRNKIYTGQK
jgi:hypothetical protein